MKYLALIPARGGSKGIPGKNLISLAGRPLIDWTVRAAKRASALDDIVITSDDPTILKFAVDRGISTIKLPKHLTRDRTHMVEVISHVIDQLESAHVKPEYLVLLQPTSPLRTASDINKAIRLLQRKKASSLISVTQDDSRILKSFLVNRHGYLGSINNAKYPFTPRLELPPVYKSNGAIYIIKTSLFKKQKSFLIPNAVPFVMPLEKSIDIDTMADLHLAQNFLFKK